MSLETRSVGQGAGHMPVKNFVFTKNEMGRHPKA